MSATELLQEQIKDVYGLLETVVSDVSEEQLYFQPDGKANPIGANYAHALLTVDLIVNGLVRNRAPLAFSAFTGRTGLSELPPIPGQENGPFPSWSDWAKRVKIELAALRHYGQAVFNDTLGYLASLSDEDLNQSTPTRMGPQPVRSFFTIVVTHTANHTGEISTLKGLQGQKGYPV